MPGPVTIGYRDIVPLHGEARMLAALEWSRAFCTLRSRWRYLVGAHKQQGTSQQ